MAAAISVLAYLQAINDYSDDDSSEEDHETLSEASDGISDASEETIDYQDDDPDYDPGGTAMDDTEDSNHAQPQPSPADDDESSNASVNDEVVAEGEVPDEPGCAAAAAADDKPFVATQRGSSEDDGQCCTICFEPWTTSSEHRLVSLRCGHLFGRSCITRWLKGQNTRCPQCNSRARRSEIRNIYAKAVKALDSSERDKALRDLAKESELRRAAEMNAAQERMKHMLTIQECERLKKELMETQRLLQEYRSGIRVGNSQCASSNPAFTLVQSIDIAKNGGCRIVDSSSMLGMLLVSQPSSNILFSGFGFRKISTHDMKPSEFVLVHQKAIRDMAFHLHDGLVLTASQDKTLKITNVLSNAVVQTYNVPSDAWSCAWDAENDAFFYGGLKTGEVLVFDIRMTNRHVRELPKYGAKTPVVSLQYLLQPESPTHRTVGGPIVGKLSDCSFYQKNLAAPHEDKAIPLPAPGPVTCLSSISTGNCLISCRPSAKAPNVTHTLCDFVTSSSGELVCIPVKTLVGGRSQLQLTRTKLLSHPDKESSSLVCAGDEESHGILVWDGSSGERIINMKTCDSVLDICGLKVNSKSFLTALVDKSLLLYSWNGV